MTTQLRLTSVVLNGVGGPESGAIDLIYSYLLSEFGQNGYSYIAINQIGDELNEFVMEESGKKVHVNIRYPAANDFDSKNIHEKNTTRLDVINIGLLRIAKEKGKLNAGVLEEIKAKIIYQHFLFDFIVKAYVKKKNRQAKIVVRPLMDRFDYFLLMEEDGLEKSKTLIFSGGTTIYYFDRFFAKGKWQSENEFVITGKANEMEMYFFCDTCQVEYVNLTTAPKPRLFEIYKSRHSSEDYMRWR
ncbi:MAG: hypothetical protein QM731_03955 [Chitinophagaceae bacterium]